MQGALRTSYIIKAQIKDSYEWVKDVFIYGDWGHFSFDKINWTCNVHNLEYGDLDYQMRKLSRESQMAVYLYDESTCSQHIIDWLQDCLHPTCANCNDIIEAFRQFLDDNVWVLSNCDIDEFCEKHNCDELTDIFYFVSEALLNTDENEWIAWLRNNISRLEEFEDSYTSTLWDAGKCINQGFLVSMYALEVCSEKLQLEKEQENCIESEY